ncbi:MAG: DUF1573 domain-containing protein [Planctomycetota bacterium]
MSCSKTTASRARSVAQLTLGVLLALPLSTSLAIAQQTLTTRSYSSWQDRAFPVKDHNFGTVAVAAKTEFRFQVNNPFSQPMHIRNVRASCGCTTPIIESAYIQPGQTGSILARFNTDTFKGQKGATLTVVVDQPVYSEVRLRVDGYIRSDMVFHPGTISFGKIDRGDAVTGSTKVYYAGRTDWDIVDVRSNVPWLIPERKLIERKGSRAQFELTVTVREDAPEGVFQNEIILVTNDNKRPNVPFQVSGNVDSPLSIAPQAIALGSLKPGQKVEQRLVIKGASPFTIDSLTAEGWDVQFPKSTSPRKVHIVPVIFTPGEKTGPQKVTVEINASGEESITAKAVLTADVREQ